MGPRAGLDGQKISSLPGFDPGPSSPLSVVIPTELPGPQASLIFPYYFPAQGTNFTYKILPEFYMLNIAI